MTQRPDLDQLSPEQLRQLAAELLVRVEAQDRIIVRSQALNEKLTYELALLRRHRFAKRGEQLSAVQISLLDEVVDAAIEAELETVRPQPAPSAPKQQPKRSPLPPELPRTLIRHEPEQTRCR